MCLLPELAFLQGAIGVLSTSVHCAVPANNMFSCIVSLFVCNVFNVCSILVNCNWSFVHHCAVCSACKKLKKLLRLSLYLSDICNFVLEG